MISYFAQWLFSASLLLLAAMVASLLFRRASASFQYKLWNYVMIGLLLLPLLILLVPQQMLGVIPLTPDELETQLKPVAPETLPAPHYLSEEIRYLLTDPKAKYDESENLRQAELEWETVWMNDKPATLTQLRQAAAASTPTVAPSPSIPAFSPKQYNISLPSLSQCFPGLWITGTLVLICRFLLSFRAARKLLGRMLPVENEAVRKLADGIAKRLWVYRPITLLQNEVATVPFTLGVRRPTVVLPSAAVENWSESQLRTILTHEIAHIQRGDVWGQWLTQFVFCLYWLHPLIWFAAWRIRVTRELACDDLVLLSGSEPADFADMLLELANSFPAKSRFAPGCGVAVFERRNIVRQRITSILNTGTRRIPVGWIGTLALLFFAAIGVTFASVLSPFADRHSERVTQEMLQEFRQELAACEPDPLEIIAKFQHLQRIRSEYDSEGHYIPEKAAKNFDKELNNGHVRLELRFMMIPEPFGKTLLANRAMDWTGGLLFPGRHDYLVETPGPYQTEPQPGMYSLATTVPLPLHFRFMGKANAKRFSNIFQNHSRASILQAPKFTLISGQSAHINDTTERCFVTGLIPVVGDFAVGYQPITQTFQEGTNVKCQATLLEDRSCRIDYCVAEFARMDDAELVTIRKEAAKTASKDDAQAGVAMIQVPNVRSYRISIPEIVIPEGMSLLVAVPGIVQSPVFDPMFLMITTHEIETD